MIETTLDMSAFVSGAAGVLSALCVGGLVIRGKFARVEKLEDAMTTLQTQRVAGIEKRLEDLGRDGCSVGLQVRTKLETVIAQNNEMLLEVKKLNRESENQVTRMTTVERSASKLWDKFDEHRQNHPGAAPKGA